MKQHLQSPLILPENLTRAWVEQSGVFSVAPAHDLTLDCSALKNADSAGLAFLRTLHKRYEGAGRRLILKAIPDDILSRIENWGTEPVVKPVVHESFSVRLGTTVWLFSQELLKAFSVLAETLYWGTFGMVLKKDFPKGAVGEQMYQLGLRAFGIVGLMSFLVGIVLSLQTAIQLRMYGGDVFLVPMLTISMVREFGPLMTAIILAGRSGSATTAEIATMGVQEELDALRTMGINTIQYIVVPKFWAITMTMPVLSILAVATGMFGGFLVGTLYSGIAPSLFWTLFTQSLIFKDFLAGFVKSVVFSWLIIWIGSYYGFRVKGGAEEVGRETTNSVVSCIFVIILADALFSFII